MKKTVLVANIFIFLIFIIVVFVFSRIILNSSIVQSMVVNNMNYNSYAADHQPIKIFPKSEKGSYLTTNQRVYDFINKESWEFKPKIAQKKPVKKLTTHQLKSEQHIKKKETAGDTVNYKNHRVHIVSMPDTKKLTEKKSNISVQLGAFNAYNTAVTEKKRIIKLFPNITTKYEFNIEKAQLKDKGLIYRLKVRPFNNVLNAKKFCTDIRKKDIGCFFTH